MQASFPITTLLTLMLTVSLLPACQSQESKKAKTPSKPNSDDASCLKLGLVQGLPPVDPAELVLSNIKSEESPVGSFRKGRVVADVKSSSPLPDAIYYTACSSDETSCVHATTVTGIDYNPTLPSGTIFLKGRACVFEQRALVKDPARRVALTQGMLLYCGDPKTSVATQDRNTDEKLNAALTEQYQIEQQIQEQGFIAYQAIAASTNTRQGLGLASAPPQSLMAAGEAIKAMGPGLFAALLALDFKDNLQGVLAAKAMQQQGGGLALAANGGSPCVSDHVLEQLQKKIADSTSATASGTRGATGSGSDSGSTTSNGAVSASSGASTTVGTTNDTTSSSSSSVSNGSETSSTTISDNNTDGEQTTPQTGSSSSPQLLPGLTKRDAVIAMFAIGGALTVGGIGAIIWSKRDVEVGQHLLDKAPVTIKNYTSPTSMTEVSTTLVERNLASGKKYSLEAGKAGALPICGLSLVGCKQDYYEVLGVNKSADLPEIKKAFRKKALLYHPDRGGDPELFKNVNTAYEALGDAQRKNAYDLWGQEQYETEIKNQSFRNNVEKAWAERPPTVEKVPPATELDVRPRNVDVGAPRASTLFVDAGQLKVATELDPAPPRGTAIQVDVQTSAQGTKAIPLTTPEGRIKSSTVDHRAATGGKMAIAAGLAFIIGGVLLEELSLAEDPASSELFKVLGKIDTLIDRRNQLNYDISDLTKASR